MKNKAFTLVELLVVISVIGILASLLLPSLSAVQEKAKQIKCKSNLSQFGKTLQIYLQDFGRDRGYPDTNGVGYICRVYQYNMLQDMELYICPSSSDEDPTKEWLRGLTDEYHDDPTNPGCSYAGRRNKVQKRYPGIFRLFKNTSLTAVASDDWKGISDRGNHEEGQLVNFLFLDTHVQHTRISAKTDQTPINGDEEGWMEFSTRENNLSHPLTN